jgi:hypothetical protein
LNSLKLSLVCASTAVVCFAGAHALLGQTNFPKQFVVPQQMNGVLATNGDVGALIGVGDLNGDGRPDILYADTEEIATGAGTFAPVRLPFTFGGSNSASQLIDVNGDGKLDVVQAIPAYEYCDTYPDGTPYCTVGGDALFLVSLGNGDGTFKSAITLDLGQQGSGVATLAMADVNGDGRPDALMSGNGVSDDATSPASFVILNDGGGNFHLASTSGYMRVLATADFNGDGKTDLVADRSGMTIMFGKGDGTFTPGQNFPTVNIFAAAVGDFNHDGHLDIAAANPGFATYIAWGHAGGSFANPQRISNHGGVSIAAVDLNRDGYLDLIAEDNGLAVFTNQRNGTFSNPRLYASALPTAGPMALANFNGDLYTDVVFGNEIAYGSFGAEFLAPQIAPLPFAGFMAAYDFNGDGIGDVAAASQTSSTLTVFPATGKGYFNPPVSYNTAVTNGMVAVGDVNGDGHADLVVVRSAQTNLAAPDDVSVLFGNGDGTFRAAVSSKLLPQPRATFINSQFYVVDVNRDGKADLVGEWGVALSHGDGTFASPSLLPSAIQGIISGVSVDDFNQDGFPDLVVGTYFEATIYTLLNDGNGKFTLTHTEKLNYHSPTLNALTTADMNKDGIPDLIYHYTAIPSGQAYDRVVVELGDGAGSFGNASGTRLNTNIVGYDRLLTGDFNRDGQMDVVVLTQTNIRSPVAGDSVFMRGYGNGSLSPPQYFPLQMLSGVVVDLNGDGAPDIVGPSLADTGVERVLNTLAQ